MHIVFEFVGGFLDGDVAIGDMDEPLSDSMAGGYFVLSKNGTIGEEFVVHSPAAIEAIRNNPALLTEQGHKWHKYRVADRSESPNEVVLRAVYAGVTTACPDSFIL